MKTCHYCKGPLRRRRIEHMHSWGDWLASSEGEKRSIQVCSNAHLQVETHHQ